MFSLHWIIGLMSNAAFSLLLMGLVVGFGAGKWRAGSVAVAYTPPAQVIQAPLPQALPPPGGGGCGL